MYTDTVTVFNRYENRMGVTWYPTVLENVNLNIDKASIVRNYGAESTDNAVLNVRLAHIGKEKVAGGKTYLLPKTWANQANDELGSTVTFARGDFFLVGEYPVEDKIDDDDFMDGFYNYMNDKYDQVFVVTSVSEFSVIPHLEITGK